MGRARDRIRGAAWEGRRGHPSGTLTWALDHIAFGKAALLVKVAVHRAEENH